MLIKEFRIYREELNENMGQTNKITCITYILGSIRLEVAISST